MPPQQIESATDKLMKRTAPLQHETQSQTARVLLGEEDTSKLTFASESLKTSTAEKAARILRLQSTTGLPQDMIERNLEQIEGEAKRSDFDPVRFREQSPLVARWLAEDPKHLALVSEDLTKLGYLERQFRYMKDMFQDGNETVELMKIGQAAVLGRASPEQRRRQAEIEERMGRASADYGITGFFEGIPGAIANQLPIYAQTIFGKVKGAAAGGAIGAAVGAGAGAAGAAIAGQAGPQVATPEEIVTVPGAAIGGAIKGGSRGALVGWRYGAAVEAGRMEGSLAYLEFEKLHDENGVRLDRQTAIGAAVIVGVVNGALEGLIGVENLKFIPGLRTLGRQSLKRALLQQTTRQAILRYAKVVGQTAAAEGVTEAIQSLVKDAAGELSIMMQDGTLETASTGSIMDRIFSDQNLATAWQEGRAGSQGGGGIAAIAGAATSLPLDVRRAKQSQQAATFFTAIGDAQQSIKLKETLPAKLEEVVERLTRDGPVETVYAPVDVWNEYWEKRQIDPADAASEILGSREAYDEALRTGGDMAIPTARYAMTIAGSAHNGFWSQELKLTPDAMSAREAKEMEAELDKLDQEAQAQPDEQAAGEIGETIAQQLVGKKLGPITVDETMARTFASIFEGGFKTLGRTLGMDPKELFDKYNISVTQPEEGVQKTLLGEEHEQLDKDIPVLHAFLSHFGEKYFGDTKEEAFQSYLDANPQVRGMIEKEMMLPESFGKVGFLTNAGKFVSADQATQQFEQSQMPPGFHSKAERIIQTKGPTQASVEQWKAILKDVKAEEKKWVNLDTYFELLGDNDGKPVTKNQILGWAQAHRLEIAEHGLGGDFEIDEDAVVSLANELIENELQTIMVDDFTFHNWTPARIADYVEHERPEGLSTPGWYYGEAHPMGVERWEGPFVSRAEATAVARDMMRDFILTDDTRREQFEIQARANLLAYGGTPGGGIYEAYALPGGENYREILFTAPDINPPFFTSHFDRTANLLAHTRVKDRTDTQGRKLLFIEEIQSDWHEAGRNYGYRSEATKMPDFVTWMNEQTASDNKTNIIDRRIAAAHRVDELRIARMQYRSQIGVAGNIEKSNEAEELLKNATLQFDQLSYIEHQLGNQYRELERQQQKQVPDAPFRKTWHEFIMKRMVVEAALKGYDAIAWTTGNQQNARYNLERFVTAIRYHEEMQTLLVERDGRDIITETATPERLQEVIGKELAVRLMTQQSIDLTEKTESGAIESGWRELRGPDLKIGGSGMRGFYDDILVRFANDLGRKYNTKVSDTKIHVRSLELKKIKSLDDFEYAEELTWHQRNDAGLQNEYDYILAELNDNPTSEAVEAFIAGTPEDVHMLALSEELKQGALSNEFTLFQSQGERWVLQMPLKETSAQAHADYDGALETQQMDAQRMAFRGSKISYVLSRNTIPDEEPWRVTTLYEDYPVGHTAHATYEMAVKSLEERGAVREQLGQEGEGKLPPRGRITIGEHGINIELLANANLSTFIHETGHMYLNILEDVATAPKGPESVQRDYGIIRDFLGGDRNALMTRAQHEKFARAFELYLMEGRAPTTALRGAFARFRAWMSMVYRAVQSLDVELTDEVRGVFDRLLATEEEITAAQQEQSMVPLFEDPEAAGMSPTQAAEYRAVVEDTRAKAADILSKKLIDEVRREQRAQWKAERAEVWREVAAEVNQDRDMRTLALIQYGKMPDGSEVPPELTRSRVKLSRESLVQLLEQRAKRAKKGKDEFVTTMLKRLPKPYVYARLGGTHIEIAAPLLGYSSGDELLQMLIDVQESPRGRIERLVDERMKERHGDLFTDGRLPAEAMRAIHLPDRAEVLRKELQHLASTNLATLKGLTRRVTRRLPLSDAIRAEAEKTIAAKRVKDIRPIAFQRAEAKAAKAALEALLAGDIELAFEEKQRELLNYELYRAAIAAHEQATRVMEHMAKFNRTSVRERLAKAGSDYLMQIDALRSRFEFAKVADVVLAERKEFQEFIEEHKELLPRIPVKHLDEAYRKNYKEMTLTELSSVLDTVKQIEHFARLKNRLLANKKQRTVEGAEADIVGSIIAHHKLTEEPLDFAPGFMTRRKQQARGVHASHHKAEFIFEWLDGVKDLGPAWQHLFKPTADAENQENVKMRDATNRLLEIFKAYPRKERAMWYYHKEYVPELKASFTKANLLTLALNWGNAYNRDAVVEGYKHRGWTEAGVEKALESLDQRDWLTVQAIWDFLDSYWPEVEALEKELNGLAPQRVEKLPVKTKFGEFKGGYYPIIFDSKLSWRQGAIEEWRNVKEIFGGQWARAMTRHGHTEERTDTGGKPISMELSGLTNHVADVVHDLTHRRAVIDIQRLLDRPKIRETIELAIGREQFRQLHPWLQHVANDRRGDFTNPVEGLLAQARTGATIVNMGWKFTTAAAQVLSYTNTVHEIGVEYSSRGLAKVYSQPWKLAERWRFVTSRSEFMKDRLTNYDRDVRDALKRMNVAGVTSGPLSILSSYAHPVRNTWFYLIGLMDMGVSLPSWLGAYGKAMDGKVDGLTKGDELSAIDYADKVIRQTQGVGAAKDMAMVQRGPESVKLFTMFYSYFNVLYNQFAKTFHRLEQDKNYPRFVASMVLLWLVPAVLADLIVGRGPDDDDDEGWGEWLIKTGVRYPFQTVIMLRDVINGMDDYGYEPSAAFDAFEAVANVGKAVPKILTDEEITRADVRNAVMATGYVTQLPSRQIWLTGEYFYDWMTGETSPAGPLDAAWRATMAGTPK